YQSAAARRSRLWRPPAVAAGTERRASRCARRVAPPSAARQPLAARASQDWRRARLRERAGAGPGRADRTASRRCARRGMRLGLAPDWPAPKNVRAFVTERGGAERYGRLNLATHVGDDAL